MFGPLLLIGGGALAWLRADIRSLRTETQTVINDLRTETQTAINDLRTEIRATNARLDALTQIILTSALSFGQPPDPPRGRSAARNPAPAHARLALVVPRRAA